MKLLIFLLLPITSFGQSYIDSSEGANCPVKMHYKSESECLKSGATKCLLAPKDFVCGLYDESTKQVDDTEKPILGNRSKVTSCSDAEDCGLKSQTINCTSGRDVYFSEDHTEVWCNEIVGYEQKTIDVYVENLSKISSANQLKSAVEKSEKVRYLMEEGKKLYAFFRSSNDGKGLTKAQRKQMRTSFSSIRDDLFDGDLCSAREDILAVPVDGTLVLQTDKDLFVAKIDSLTDC